MKRIDILHETDWVSLRKLVWPEKNVNGYDYLHEDRCNGKIVSILPFRRINNNLALEYLLRNEITPCWGMSSNISSITGGVDDGNSVEETVIHEMDEESGYKIENSDLIPLGTCRGTKSSDTTYYLYTIDLTDKFKTGNAEGDGSELERIATCFWSDTIKKAVDPLIYTLYYKLHQYLDTIINI